MSAEICQKLREVALRENREGEFPDWLLAEVMPIAEHPERYLGQDEAIEALAGQIREFDPYAGTGCFGASVGVEAIRATIGRIMAKRAAKEERRKVVHDGM